MRVPAPSFTLDPSKNGVGGALFLGRETPPSRRSSQTKTEIAGFETLSSCPCPGPCPGPGPCICPYPCPLPSRIVHVSRHHHHTWSSVSRPSCNPPLPPLPIDPPYHLLLPAASGPRRIFFPCRGSHTAARPSRHLSCWPTTIRILFRTDGSEIRCSSFWSPQHGACYQIIPVENERVRGCDDVRRSRGKKSGGGNCFPLGRAKGMATFLELLPCLVLIWYVRKPLSRLLPFTRSFSPEGSCSFDCVFEPNAPD